MSLIYHLLCCILVDDLLQILFQNTAFGNDIIPVESYIDSIQCAHIGYLSGLRSLKKKGNNILFVCVMYNKIIRYMYLYFTEAEYNIGASLKHTLGSLVRFSSDLIRYRRFRDYYIN